MNIGLDLSHVTVASATCYTIAVICAIGGVFTNYWYLVLCIFFLSLGRHFEKQESLKAQRDREAKEKAEREKDERVLFSKTLDKGVDLFKWLFP
jgi:hypothetical protein